MHLAVGDGHRPYERSILLRRRREKITTSFAQGYLKESEISTAKRDIEEAIHRKIVS
jgi:hypothetical protein